MSAKIIVGLILTAIMLSFVPLALIARSRASKSPRAAAHLVLDMDKQPRFDPQMKSAMYADGRAARPQIPGTVAREDLEIRNETLTVSDGAPRMVGGQLNSFKVNSPEQYAALAYGRVRAPGTSDEQFNALRPPKEGEPTQGFYINAFPQGIEVTPDFLTRGRERFNIYCSPCHGDSGYGDGMVHRAVLRLQVTNPDAVSTWAAPANLTEDKIKARPLGHLYNTIANGFNNMPAYDKQISIPDRWAIVAYVQALQHSQGGKPK